MSQLNVNTITNEAGTGAPDFTSGLKVGGTSYPSVGPLSNRNFVINGAMQVAQRGTSFTTSGVQYGLDRFAHFSGSPPANNVQRSTDVPANEGFSYSLRLDSTDLRHAVELPAAGVAGVFYNGQTITLSFYAKVASGSFSTTVDARFGNGASFSNVTSPFSSSNNSITMTTTWQRFSIQYTIDQTPTGSHLALLFSIGATVNVSFITGVQLEAGDTATPFEHRSFGQELALCQRYYQSVIYSAYLNATGGNTMISHSRWHVPMRATPTVTKGDGTSLIGTAWIVSAVYTTGVDTGKIATGECREIAMTLNGSAEL